MPVVELNRKPGESELTYINRLGTAKYQGLIDMTWQELAGIFNKNLRDSGVEWDESTYRKKYASIKKIEEEFGTGKTDSEETADLKALKVEIEKEKVKLRDERNEYKRLIREQARRESYQEQFVRAIEQAASKYPLKSWYTLRKPTPTCGDTDMIIPLTDIHAGIVSKNYWNDYNTDVLEDRLHHYFDRIVEIKERHGCSGAYVVGSEFLSGLIHPALRIENNQDLIDQFLTVMDNLCGFLIRLSEEFEFVNFYVAPGNHSRITANKDHSVAHENFDNLIIPFVSAKLQNFKNIHCFTNDIEQSMAMFTVRNQSVVAIHGDKDSPDKVVNNLWNMYHAKVDIVLLGHRHTNAMETVCDVKVVQSGCLSGTDLYAIDIRKANRPEQAIMIINDREGLDCIYDVKF